MDNNPMSLVNQTYVSVNAFVDELWRAGVRHVVICPGSRSTPLALTFAAQPRLHCWTHIDERSAAFFALGMAKRLAQTVVLLSTSGTAAANFFPALVEAKLSAVSLLVLTADRPHELRDCGAPQAIDQNRLYGSYVKWFVDMALPEATTIGLRSIRTIANRAVAQAQAISPGPVHLNFPFREPLTPEPVVDQPLPPFPLSDHIAWDGRSESLPYITVSEAVSSSLPDVTIARLAHQGRTLQCGLIIVGPQNDPALAEPLVQLAERLGYPILADPLSQLRCGHHDHSYILSSYDAFLRSVAFVEQNVPQLVLRFGALPTAKPLQLYLQQYANCPQIIIDGYGGWQEPTQLASELLHTHSVTFCQDLLAALEVQTPPGERGSTTPWLSLWQQTDQVTRRTVRDAVQEFKPLFEGRIFTELADLLPDGATLYVGNSMPVRDLDTFFWCNQRQIRVFGNRGANGIDGIVSSALGTSAVSDRGEPTLLVIGDLSFFHDLNGLLAAHLHPLNMVIVLVNNDGGGIFSFLPQAAYPQHFERLFGTPTGLDFRPVVEMYSGHFLSIEHWEIFRQAVKHGFEVGGLHVIEVRTERAGNVTMHRQLWKIVEQALGQSVL